MGVLVEGIAWEPNALLFVFLAICIFMCLVISTSISSSSFSSTSHRFDGITSGKSKSSSPFNFSSAGAFLLQRKFLLIFSLASVMEGMWSVFGEYELAYHEFGKDDILASMCLGYSVSLLCGAVLGFLFDFFGHKNACLLFSIIHLAVGVWRKTTAYPNLWFASAFLPLATSIFSCSFEAWLVVESKEQSYRQDTLSETLWLMVFIDSAMLIASQVLVNKILSDSIERGVASCSTVSIFLAIITILHLRRRGKTSQRMTDNRISRVSYMHLLYDKRLCLLGLAHTSLYVSVAVVWVLWAPTLVADGRKASMGLIFPCLMGARMLGSTLCHLFLNSSSLPRTEDIMMYAYIALALALSILAYDYQEIGVIVSLLCLFHAGVGFITPSLARLRAMHVPNEVRGGMIGLSLTPGNGVVLFLLIQRGYYHTIENSTMLALAAGGLLLGSACVYYLRRGGKYRYQSGHKL